MYTQNQFIYSHICTCHKTLYLCKVTTHSRVIFLYFLHYMIIFCGNPRPHDPPTTPTTPTPKSGGRDGLCHCDGREYKATFSYNPQY